MSGDRTAPLADAERPREDRGDSPSPRRASGWHTLDVGHLVMGVALVGLGIVWLLLSTETVALEETRWLLALPWLAAGAAGLVGTVLRGRRRPDERAPLPRWKQELEEMKAAQALWKREYREQHRAWKERHRRSMAAWHSEWSRPHGGRGATPDPAADPATEDRADRPDPDRGP